MRERGKKVVCSECQQSAAYKTNMYEHTRTYIYTCEQIKRYKKTLGFDFFIRDVTEKYTEVLIVVNTFFHDEQQ